MLNINIKNKLVIVFGLLMLSHHLEAQENQADFSLPGVGNVKPFTLSEAKGKYVALHFLLKTECPYCIRHTNDYMEKSSTLPQVIQVFIKPDSEAEIVAWAENLDGVDFPIFLDKDAQLAKRMKIPNGYSFHNQLVHFPALILLDPNGREVYRYIGKNNKDRLPFEKLKDVIDKIEGK